MSNFRRQFSLDPVAVFVGLLGLFVAAPAWGAAQRTFVALDFGVQFDSLSADGVSYMEIITKLGDPGRSP